MKLMVMDGNSILNRAYYAIPPLTTRDGLYTHAIHGFLTTLLRVRREENPDALCVAFDVHAPTFRHQADPSYKSTRRPMPEELRVQIPALKETLDALRIPRYELPGWEADDLLGTIARKCETADWDCLILTGDRDALQLITDRTSVRLITGRTAEPVVTPERFREKYGFDPVHLIDLKALMGDSSDHISGVAGIGEKTAMSLIQTYGSIDEIYAKLPDIDAKPGVIRKLTQGEEQARHSYWLAKIVTDAPLEFVPEEQICQPPSDTAYAQFQKLELYKLTERFGLRRVYRERSSSGTPSHTPETLHRDFRTQPFSGAAHTEILHTPEDVRNAAQIFSQSGEHLCICAGENLFPLIMYAVKARTAYILLPDTFDAETLSVAVQTLSGTDAPKIGHNIKDLQRQFLARGIETAHWTFDTALAAYLLDATSGDYNLERLCVRYLGFSPEWNTETSMEPEQLSLLDATPENPSADENSADGTGINSTNTAEHSAETAPERSTGKNKWERQIKILTAQSAAIAWLYDVLEAELSKQNLLELYRTAELPLCTVLAEMENTGCLVDQDALRTFGNTLSERIREHERVIAHLAGTSFNLNSPKQLGEVLFEKLGLPHGKKTRTGWTQSSNPLMLMDC